jgi:hypothetical protein
MERKSLTESSTLEDSRSETRRVVEEAGQLAKLHKFASWEDLISKARRVRSWTPEETKRSAV